MATSPLPERIDARFEHLDLTVDGVPLHARTAVDGLPPDAPAVVLVHGLGLSSTYMLPVGERLADHYRVYAPDLPGFGRSGEPGKVLDVGGLGDALAAWMEAAGIERAALLGNSFGCQVAVECAVRHPDRVERVILQGPTTPPEERSWFWQLVRWRQNANPRPMGKISRRDYRACGLRRLIRTFQYSLDHRVEDRLPHVRAPVLVVRGARDPICDQGWALEVARRAPDGRLAVIPGRQHTLVWTSPLELARVCRPFLEDDGDPEMARAASYPQKGERGPGRAPLAGFDSSSSMVRALSGALEGHGFPGVGLVPSAALPFLRPPLAALEALPAAVQRQFYIWAGWSEAVRPTRLAGLRADDLARWVVEQYPHESYPGAMIGSSNGALIHLCAALGIPWLPQTFLIPVRRHGLDPDDMEGDAEWGIGPGSRLLGSNPDLVLHHMHDPNQDRLMIRRMSYFRVKFARLPNPYRRFLEERLEPDATLFTSECELGWPARKMADRHLFQPGAYGGLAPAEYLHGSDRVAGFLAEQGAPVRAWTPPSTDGVYPEAEWGFEPAILPELEEWAAYHGARLRRIVYGHPEDPSPLVAELYREWHRSRRIPASRLLVESFALIEPDFAIRSGSVPFWVVFPVDASADALEKYLDSAETYDEIYLLLFSHGVRSAGIASPERWRSLVGRARRIGRLPGFDGEAFPRHFGIYARYFSALRQAIGARHARPRRLTVEELDEYLRALGEYEGIEWMV